MDEEIEIEFVLDCDIDRELIPTITIDFIDHFEKGILTKKQIREDLQMFVIEEFYNYAEAVKRALDCIEIIFK